MTVKVTKTLQNSIRLGPEIFQCDTIKAFGGLGFLALELLPECFNLQWWGVTRHWFGILFRKGQDPFPLAMRDCSMALPTLGPTVAKLMEQLFQCTNKAGLGADCSQGITDRLINPKPLIFSMDDVHGLTFNKDRFGKVPGPNLVKV
jgi:hypothetical protein